jgi:hypothetical protein
MACCGARLCHFIQAYLKGNVTRDNEFYLFFVKKTEVVVSEIWINIEAGTEFKNVMRCPSWIHLSAPLRRKVTGSKDVSNWYDGGIASVLARGAADEIHAMVRIGFVAEFGEPFNISKRVHKCSVLRG